VVNLSVVALYSTLLVHMSRLQNIFVSILLRVLKWNFMYFMKVY
jgi:hypothetical protein